MVGRYCSYQLPKHALAIFSNNRKKTLRQTGWIAVILDTFNLKAVPVPLRREHCRGVEVGEVEGVGDPELVFYCRPRVGDGGGERWQPHLWQGLAWHGAPRGRVHRVRQVRQLGTVLLGLYDPEREISDAIDKTTAHAQRYRVTCQVDC